MFLNYVSKRVLKSSLFCMNTGEQNMNGEAFLSLLSSSENIESDSQTYENKRIKSLEISDFGNTSQNNLIPHANTCLPVAHEQYLTPLFTD